MRKLFYALLVLSFISCKSSKNEWNKEFLTNKCKTNATKDGANSDKTQEQIDEICACSVNKLLVRYKSEAELNGDKAAADAIGNECAEIILMPKSPDFKSDTVIVQDTTNQ